ncbi:MAG TPA: A24 family peptidase [Alphaproteobacteria bacterium]|nr:A24 family peptidase [Alphaproteobacteria bacterium]
MNRTYLLAFVAALLGLWAYFAAGWPAAAWLTAIACVLVMLTDHDLRTGLLPNELTLPLLASGLVFASYALGIGWQQSLLGAVAGGGVAGLVIALSAYATGKPGWGMGDLKLLAALGAWVGGSGILPIVLFSSCLAVAWLGWLRFGRGRRVRQIAFGPFLAIGGWLVLLYQPIFWQILMEYSL